MNEPHIAAADDPHIAELDMNWSVVLGEEFLIVFPIGFLALVLDRALGPSNVEIVDYH